MDTGYDFAQLALAQTFPQVVNAGKGLPSQLGQALGRALDSQFAQWSELFSPLMGAATAAEFARGLVQQSLADNPLLKDLSERFGAQIQRSASPEHSLSELSRATTPKALAQQLSAQYGQEPKAFPPFQTLSRSAQEAVQGPARSNTQSSSPSNATSQSSSPSNATSQNAGAPSSESAAPTPQPKLPSVRMRAGVRDIGNLSKEDDKEDEKAAASASDAKVSVPLGERVTGFIDDAIDKGKEELNNLKTDPVGTIRSHLPTNMKLAEDSVGVRASVLEAKGTVGDPNGDFYGQGRVALLEGRAEASGKITANLKDLTLSAHGRAEVGIDLVRAEAAVKIGNSEYLNATAAGEATVGASASAEGSVTLDPMDGDIAASIEGEAFVGARASGQVSGTVGPVSATAKGSVLAGVGVHLAGHIGMVDGKFSAGFDVGAALGIGLRLKVDVSVDFEAALKSISKLAKGAASWVKNAVGGAGKAIGKVASALSKTASVLGKNVKEGVNKAVKWVGNAAKDVGKAVESGVKSVGKAVESGVKSVGKSVESGVKSAGKKLKKILKGW